MKFCVVFLVLMSVALGAGCVSQPLPNGNAGSTDGTNPAASPLATLSPTPPPPPSAAASPVKTNAPPVTLPVLDAFFADDNFSGELQTRVGLNDEQMSRLRNVARTETAKLREDGANSAGSTAEATRAADQQIKAVVGDEKAQQLYALIQERWNGGETELAAQKPNAVPTDTRVVVNIPAYRMDLYQNGNLIKSYKVGIGYPEFPLPTGMRKADTIIFNPTWTPPDEPWVESANKVKPGQKIPAGSKLNPLGPAKIPIGLPSLIHGGKQPSRIGTFASHGCVGLTTPQLNEFIPEFSGLAGSQITEDAVEEYEKDKTNTKSVKLNQIVPVELRYETIVAEDGKLHIYRDVYDKDTNTEENLKQVLAVYGVTPDQLSEEERAQVSGALKEMSRDANGNLDSGNSANENKSAANGKKNESPHVTRTIKGRKEVVVEIAALQGKGYPAPVNLNTGGAPTPKDSSMVGKKSASKKKG
jgi:lipoprotein-anchoring transpeptidase ErfK/SrfK